MVKGSKYIGVHRCNKTNNYYFISKCNKIIFKSRNYKDEKKTAKKYDNFILKKMPFTKKINFPISQKNNVKTKKSKYFVNDTNFNNDKKSYKSKKNNNKKSYKSKKIVQKKNNNKKSYKSKKIVQKKYNNISNNNIVTLKEYNSVKRPKVHEYIKNIVYDKQDDKCYLCKGKLGVCRIIDHIIPRSIGGFDNINNYQALCGVCNKWKTYNYDHHIRRIIKNKLYISIKTIVDIQLKEYQKFFENK